MPPPPPLSRKEAEVKAQRDGLRAAIKLANGDTYTGEWKNDLRHGTSGAFVEAGSARLGIKRHAGLLPLQARART